MSTLKRVYKQTHKCIHKKNKKNKSTIPSTFYWVENMFFQMVATDLWDSGGRKLSLERWGWLEAYFNQIHSDESVRLWAQQSVNP